MCQINFLLIAFFAAFAAAILHSPARPGCPVVVNPMANFVIERFSGIWYEIQKYSSQFDGGKCVAANFGSIQGTNRTLVTINYSQRVGTTNRGFNQNATMRAQMSSIWYLRYNQSINLDIDGWLYVLDTNYINYAVIFGCGNINRRQNGQMVWILSRTRTLQSEFVSQALQVLRTNRLSTTLLTSDQTNCSSGIEGL